MAVSGPTNQAPPTGPGLLTEDEFYARHLDTYDGLETYRNEQAKKVQTVINEEYSFSAFKNYKDYVSWYGARWSLAPKNADRFNSPDRYTTAIKASAAKTTESKTTSTQQSLNPLKSFLGAPLLSGINAIETTFLSDVTIGNNTVSGMSYTMLNVFVASMATGGLSGAYKAIEKLINTYANPLQGPTKQQVSTVVHAFDKYFEKILGKNYYSSDPMWQQLRADGAQHNSNFAIETKEFVDGFLGDDDSDVREALNTVMQAPVFDELGEQTGELVANMREQFQVVSNLNNIKDAGAIIEAIAGGNQKTRDLLYGKLGVTAKQVDDAAARFSIMPGDSDSHELPEIIEPNKPEDMSEATWSILRDLAKSKFMAEQSEFTSQIIGMPLAFGVGMAASVLGGPIVGIAVGAGIAGIFGGMDYSASKEALERGTAYNAATHVTGVPLESDEHVAILDENLNAATAAGLIGVASCFLIPPGSEGFLAAGVSGAVGSFTQWLGDSRQNSADHMARTQKYQFYNPETGEYDLTAEQAQQIEYDASLQVLKGMAYTVTLGALMGVGGEAVGKGIEATLRVDVAPAEEGLTHGTLKMSDGKNIPVTLKPGGTPDTVVLQKSDGTTVTATQNSNEAPVAILSDAPQEATPLHANSAPDGIATPDPTNESILSQFEIYWKEVDKPYRAADVETRLGWMNELSLQNICVDPETGKYRKLADIRFTDEQKDFWGGEDALRYLVKNFLELNDFTLYKNPSLTEAEMAELSAATARIEKIKLEATTEQTFAEKGIVSHLDLPQFTRSETNGKNPKATVMTYYHVGQSPDGAVSAHLAEAIYFGASGDRQPNTDVWAIDVPVRARDEVISGEGTMAQTIKTSDENGHPEEYGLRHIGVLRDGQLIFDEGADVVLYGDISINEPNIPNTDRYREMQSSAAVNNGKLPPEMQREVRIPGGTVWRYSSAINPKDRSVFGTETYPSFVEFLNKWTTG